MWRSAELIYAQAERESGASANAPGASQLGMQAAPKSTLLRLAVEFYSCSFLKAGPSEPSVPTLAEGALRLF
jgi:hypothetical protein